MRIFLWQFLWRMESNSALRIFSKALYNSFNTGNNVGLTYSSQEDRTLF